MKILVLGGNGFIGGHVLEEIASRGITQVSFDRHIIEDHIFQPEGTYDFFLGDVRDRNAVNEAVSKCDGAINLAGILGTSEAVDNPFPAMEANIVGGLNFLQACREHNKRGVQIAVGNHFMNNTYSITKTTVERFALMFNKEHGTKIAIVRGLNAFGPRQKHKPIRKITPNFITRALRGEPIKIFGTGESVMDMIYVKDLARILVEAVLNPNARFDFVYSAGPGIDTSVNEIAGMINIATGNTVGAEHIEMRAGEQDNSIVLGDPSTLASLGITLDCSRSTLLERMKETAEWYREFYPFQQD